MNTSLSAVKIQVTAKLCLKDPETSMLGRKIVSESIVLIDQIGFDNFTFKKLGERIGSNESSVYRYFENKHKLLIYLSSWYWSWIEYRLTLATANIEDPWCKLKNAIIVLTGKVENNVECDYLDEEILNRIIISDFTKTFLTKEVDDENRNGFFVIYKRVVNALVLIIREVTPDYAYARCLASGFVEGALHQHFLKQHFTTITDCQENLTPTDFYLHLITQILK